MLVSVVFVLTYVFIAVGEIQSFQVSRVTLFFFSYMTDLGLRWQYLRRKPSNTRLVASSYFTWCISKDLQMPRIVLIEDPAHAAFTHGCCSHVSPMFGLVFLLTYPVCPFLIFQLRTPQGWNCKAFLSSPTVWDGAQQLQMSWQQF